MNNRNSKFNMLPPADDSVLQANPAFAAVYHRLAGSLINTDGSSRDLKLDEQRAVVREELKAHRIEVTKHQILKQAIAQAIPSPPPPQQDRSSEPSQAKQLPAPSRIGRRSTRPTATTIITIQPSHADKTPLLPPDLLDLLTLLPPFLSSAASLPAPSLALLLSNPPFTALSQHFPQITALLSAQLARQASTLAKAVYPTTNPSFIHRQIPSLAITTETLLSTLVDSKAHLSRLRAATAHELADGYMAQQLAAVALLLDLLEAKHAGHTASPHHHHDDGDDHDRDDHDRNGSGGSSITDPQVLRATHASLSAQTWSLASRALLSHAVDTVYPADARAALGSYRRHLAGARMREVSRDMKRLGKI